MIEVIAAKIAKINDSFYQSTGVKSFGWFLALAAILVPAVALYVFIGNQYRASIRKVDKAISSAERTSMRKGQLEIGRAQETLKNAVELKKLQDQVNVKKVDTDAKYNGMADRIDNAKTFRELKKIRDDLNTM